MSKLAKLLGLLLFMVLALSNFCQATDVGVLIRDQNGTKLGYAATIIVPHRSVSISHGIATLLFPSGSGCGDMLYSENLSGLANKTTSRANLGDGNVLHVFLGDGSMGPAPGGDNQTVQAPRLGGTGQNSSAWTLCFPYVTSGIWGCDGNTTRELREIGALAVGGKAATAGVADTATALAANGANCSAGYAPLGVDASGAAEGCWAVTPTAIGASTLLVDGNDTKARRLLGSQAALTYPVTGPASPTAGVLVKWGPSGQALVDSLALGTMTPTKYCTYETATGLTCVSEGGGGGLTGPMTGDIALNGHKVTGVTQYIAIDVRAFDDNATGSAGPPAQVGTSPIRTRDFAGATASNHAFFPLPPLPDMADGNVTFAVSTFVTAATAPANGEKVDFTIQCTAIGNSESAIMTYYAPTHISFTFDATYVQYDRMETAYSGTHVINGWAATKNVNCRFERPQDNANDTYAQMIGVRRVIIGYHRSIQ